MLTKRVVVCLDVFEGKVVKGVKFKNHKVMGDVLALAQKYEDQGADELVFYDIGASAQNKKVNSKWVKDIRSRVSLPFCVAGGIRSVEQAKILLFSGADKISVNSPALERPSLVKELSDQFGKQCVVVGMDALYDYGLKDYFLYQYTGVESQTLKTKRTLLSWAKEVCSLGAGEIVLNCMGKDGTSSGFDLNSAQLLSEQVSVPVIASGGAGCPQDFMDLFQKTKVSGGLGAGVFHRNEYTVSDIKNKLRKSGVCVR